MILSFKKGNEKLSILVLRYMIVFVAIGFGVEYASNNIVLYLYGGNAIIS